MLDIDGKLCVALIVLEAFDSSTSAAIAFYHAIQAPFHALKQIHPMLQEGVT